MSNKLREDLVGQGWSMQYAAEWKQRFIQELECWDHTWVHIDGWSGHRKFFVEEVPLPSILLTYAEEWFKLLCELLPDESFFLGEIETQSSREFKWHIDGGYLRVVLVCNGEGTIVARSFDDNITTPPDHNVILTARQRMAKIGIAGTWHASPSSEGVRRLVILTFRTSWDCSQ
jgi:hypothetical protein